MNRVSTSNTVDLSGAKPSPEGEGWGEGEINTG